MPRRVTRIAAQPTVLATSAWPDHALVDSGEGAKLERYGPFSVVRPEPQAFWPRRLPPERWSGADAVFDPAAAQEDEDAGRWRFAHTPPERFPLRWRELVLEARFTNFRHLALFPEQAANWDWLAGAVRALSTGGGEPPRVLNLFGYTGAASLAMAAAGAHVTHVDASKKSVAWAKENALASGLADRPVRWLTEDARRWVERETRRGARYEGIVLDPPKYGRGPGGEVWRLYEDLPELLRLCAGLLSDRAGFLLLNAYAERVSGLSLAHLADAHAPAGGRIDWGELALAEEGENGRAVGLSFFARWSRL